MKLKPNKTVCQHCNKEFITNSNETYCFECFGNSISDLVVSKELGIDVSVMILFKRLLSLEFKVKELEDKVKS